MPEKTEIADAETRVREMERVAKGFLEQTNRVIRQGQPRERNAFLQDVPQDSSRTRFEPAKAPAPTEAFGRGDIPAEASAPGERALQRSGLPFELDGEKILILLLILLLVREKADIKLIAALAYLLI